ncbi:MAG TPA: hypothetical protein VH139_06705 [Acidobacteriaceae bacterium]|nr:hypothetical protein [Acidobacteriaceae bacterium]
MHYLTQTAASGDEDTWAAPDGGDGSGQPVPSTPSTRSEARTNPLSPPGSA